jgi:hypothetical protein
MSDHPEHPDSNPDEGLPREGGTLPEHSPTIGEASQEKADEWGEKAGKGGDHPTPGAGEHDDPSN